MKTWALTCCLLSCLSACSGEATKRTPVTPLTARTDRNRLAQRYLNLPPQVTTVRWLVVPMGTPDSFVPGPTDSMLYAFFQLDDAGWEALKTQQLKDPQQTRFSMPCPVAIALGLRAEGPVDTDCEESIDVQAFNASAFAARFSERAGAARVRDGVLVWAMAI